MMKRLAGTLFALLLAASLTGCGLTDAPDRQTATYLDVFDTVTTVTVYGTDKESFAADEERLHALFTEYHRLYDIYHAYPGMNNLKTVNDAAGGEPVPVDDRILELLEYGLSVYEQTGGRVNILFGPVLRLWHDCREAAAADPDSAALPPQAALAAAAAHTDPACLVLDRAAGTVRLTDPQARLDVGALAKGYAVEQAAQFAEEALGWTSALLNVGGNVRAVGSKGGRDFVIGIQNPDTDSAQSYRMTVGVQNAAVVTSGDYQRYYTVNGQRYAHIIDPDTLYPAAFVRAVSVICPDSALADVLSTALFLMPVEEGVALVDRLDGVEAVWMLPDGSTRYSAGFAAYVRS